MRRLDQRHAIAFINVAEETASCPLDRASLLQRFHAQEDGAPIVSGAAAFAAMWRAIPPLRPLGLLARNALALRILNRLYAGFLLIRPRLVARLRRA